MKERPIAKNPYRLLGVGRDATAAEVVLAYARRSAESPPEDEPAFSTARDSILHDIELRGLLSDLPALDATHIPDLELMPTRTAPPPARIEEDLASALSAFAEESIPEAPPPVPAVVNPPSVPAPASVTFPESLDALWELAIGGNTREAYRRLCAYQQCHPGADVYLRLYWLLTAAPECDPEREPASWLATGLLADPASSALWELYRRELEARPEEALSRRAADLPRAHWLPERLTQLLELRWRAAARLRQWETLRLDLDTLTGHIPPTEHGTWARIGLAAVEVLAWSDDPPARELAERCFENLVSTRAYFEELAQVRERRNRLRELTTGWRKVRASAAAPVSLVELIPFAALAPFAEVRPRLLAALRDLLRSPSDLLKGMDALGASPAVLKEVDRLLEELQKSGAPPAIDPRSSRDLGELATNFLDLADRVSYRKLRPALAEFCFREALAPAALAELIEDHPLYRIILDDRHLSLLLRDDAALRTAYQAYHLFWA